MTDDAEVALQDDGVLLLRRDAQLPQVEDKPVEVAADTVGRWLQLLYLPAIFLLRGRNGRALGAPGFGGTLEEGGMLYYAMLCCAMLCVPNVAF